MEDRLYSKLISVIIHEMSAWIAFSKRSFFENPRSGWHQSGDMNQPAEADKVQATIVYFGRELPVKEASIFVP